MIGQAQLPVPARHPGRQHQRHHRELNRRPSGPPPFLALSTSARAQDDFYSNVFRQRLNLHQTDEAMRSVVFEAGKVAGKIASQLNGHPDGYRLYLDQALVKEPWANATGWHIDDVLWEFDSPMATTLWLALDDGVCNP